tara:strand:- start:1077 stop:1655 length:579 start_codon:yes stop_codon:yes gene_type:complete
MMSMIVALCVLLAAGFSFAQSESSSSDRPQRQGQRDGQRQGPRDGEGRGGPFGQVLKELELSEEQMQQVKTIMQKHREQVEAYREKNGDQAQQLRKDFRQAMEDKDYDKLHTLIDQLKTVDKDRPSMTEMAAEVRGVLNAEQQKIWDAKAEEMKNNRGKHMRRGPRGEGQSDGENAQRPRRGQRRGADATEE